MSENVHFKDFSKKRRDVRFKLDDLEIECYRAVGITSLQEVAQHAGQIDPKNARENLLLLFSYLMNEENLRKIELKLNDRESPLELDQAVDILYWLLEVYGLRPSQSSSATSSGSLTDGDGTSSTAGASVEG